MQSPGLETLKMETKGTVPNKYVLPQSRPKPFNEEFPALISGDIKPRTVMKDYANAIYNKIEKDNIIKETAIEHNKNETPSYDFDGIYLPDFKKLYLARKKAFEEAEKNQPLFTSSSEDEEEIAEEVESDSYDEDADNEGNDGDETYDSNEFNRHK